MDVVLLDVRCKISRVFDHDGEKRTTSTHLAPEAATDSSLVIK